MVDDLQQFVLVEVRLGHDQLVDALAVEHGGQVAQVAEHGQIHAVGRRSDRADELVVDPAAARAECPVQVHEVVARAGEQGVAPRTQRVQHVFCDRLVAPAQRGDRG